MHIQLLASQIPQHWETIKFSAYQAHAEDIGQEKLQPYCRELLINLLSGKLKCTLKLNAVSRDIEVIIIYEVRLNKFDNVRSIHGHTIYAFTELSPEQWTLFFLPLIEVFKRDGCDHIDLELKRASLINMFKELGFKAYSQNYTLELN
jgi:hypothetical protein